MRIVQIIDSLELGGAERMAVNYANALCNSEECSGLVATRKEGPLRNELHPSVLFLSLNRKRTIDFAALFRLRRFCTANQIEWVQAHSSSYFMAVMLKIVLPSIKIIWHDHNGLSEFVGSQKTFAIKAASFFFKGIVVVNEKLLHWAQSKLHCAAVLYLPNFTSSVIPTESATQLLKNQKAILCLANLRDQKNHLMLLRVAARLKITHPDWTFHLVGKDFSDHYSENLRAEIETRGLTEHVFLYGSRKDPQPIIQQAEICILTSKSEGLPVSLLEYGAMQKAVVVTAAGEMPRIVNDGINGFVTAVNDDSEFYNKLVQLADSQDLRTKLGQELFKTIEAGHSEQAVISKYLNWVAAL